MAGRVLSGKHKQLVQTAHESSKTAAEQANASQSALRILLDAASADEDALNRHAREVETMRMQVALAERRVLAS